MAYGSTGATERVVFGDEPLPSAAAAAARPRAPTIDVTKPILIELATKAITHARYTSYYKARNMARGTILSPMWDTVLLRTTWEAHMQSLNTIIILCVAGLLLGKYTLWDVFRGIVLFIPFVDTFVHRVATENLLTEFQGNRLFQILHFWLHGYNIKFPGDKTFIVSPQWLKMIITIGVYIVLCMFYLPEISYGMAVGFLLAWGITDEFKFHDGGSTTFNSFL